MSILNVVDEEGNIIGQDTRENIHNKGLLHREIHVLFYTPKKEIIFQLRGKNKDTFPNLLDTTVAGHVEIGDNIIKTALKEMLEETGIKTKESKLILVGYIRRRIVDPVTGKINNAIKAIYAFKFEGKLNDLRVEKEESQGFEIYPIKNLINGLSDKEKQRFIPTLHGTEFVEIYKKILNL